MTMRISAERFPAAALGALLVAAGCGAPSAAPVLPVRVEVFTKGSTPCAGAYVVFQAKSPELRKSVGGRSPSGFVGDDGSCQLTTFGAGDGAPAGEYGVTIVWEGKAKDVKLNFGDRPPAGADRLQGRYGDPQNPKLTATVEKGKENKFRFDVE